MLTPAEFDVWWTTGMVVIEVAWAAVLLWPFVDDYRKVCRADDLMAVADAVFGPARERIP